MLQLYQWSILLTFPIILLLNLTVKDFKTKYTLHDRLQISIVLSLVPLGNIVVALGCVIVMFGEL